MKSIHIFKVISFIVILQTFTLTAQIATQSNLKGKNFQGEIKMIDDGLAINILDFAKGEIYSCTITKENLSKDFNRFLIFTEIDQLFDELLSNKQIQINNHAMIIPLDITYKYKDYKLKIQIPLQQKRFQTETEKIQTLFQLIKTINEENQKINLYYPQPIHFTGDRTNEKIKMFEYSQNNKRVKMLGTDQALIYNHFQTVPKKGVHYFQIKIIKTANQSIFIGICGRNIKSTANVFLDPSFMGLYLANGNLYGNHKNIVATSSITLVEGQSIVKLQIDMNKKILLWYLNDSLIYMKEIWKNLVSKDFYPMVVLHTNGDIIQFIK